MLKTFTFCLLAAASVTSSGCAVDVSGQGGQLAVVRQVKRIPLTGTPAVTVRTFDGSIHLRSWDRNEILLDIERRAATTVDAEGIVVDVKEGRDEVRIEAKWPGRSDNLLSLTGWSSPSARLTVTVPKNLRIEARTGDGSIHASDLVGSVELRTGDGAVRLQRVEGDIDVVTGDGSVSARDLRGRVVVGTGDGSVNLSGRFDALRAHTGDGAIGIDALPGSSLRGKWTLSSGDGRVRLRVPSDFNAEVDAQTGDGSIRTTGVRLTKPEQAGERRHVRGRIGTGGEVLTLRTGDGSIEVVAR